MIDYVLIGGLFPEEYADPYSLHKAAAGFTIESASLRYPRSAEKGPTSRRDPEKAQGEQITPAELFAPGYRGLPLELKAILTPEEMEVERLKLDQEVFSHGERGQWMGNYEYAFLYPPYNRYNPDREGKERLFQAINYELFGNDEQVLTIYQWSTDWADYFNEWWGSFLWTVSSTHTELLVGIAASASQKQKRPERPFSGSGFSESLKLSRISR